MLYTQIAIEYDFLVQNNLFHNYLSDNFTSLIYLIYIYQYLSGNFLLNIFPLIGFSLIFLIIQNSNKKIISKKSIIFWILIILLFFSRNFVQHIFYLNSHLNIAKTIFLLFFKNKEIIMSEILLILMVISLIFLRTETFIIVLIILFLDFLKIEKIFSVKKY